MKKIILLLCLIYSSASINAQNVGACNAAQNICSNPSFTFAGNSGANGLTSGLNISNPGTNPQGINTGCLLTDGPGPQWLVMNISSSGNLGFNFGATGSPFPQTGFYDWAMWPYTPTTCSQIFANTLPPVACNWNASSTGGTGMGPIPSGGVAGNYQPSIPVVAGQQYLLLISNYSSVSTLVSFTSTGTASISCGSNAAICAGQSATVSPVGFTPMTGASFTLMPGSIVNTTGVFSVMPVISTTYIITGAGTSGGLPVVQTSTSVVNVNPQPNVAPTTTQATCTSPNNAFNLNLNMVPASATNYTINWNPLPSGVTSNTQTSSSNVPSGTYNATVIAAGGCSTTTSFSMQNVVAPTLTVQNTTGSFSITCTTPSVCMTAQATPANSTFFWTNSASTFTSNSASVCTSTLGTYTVIATHPSNTCTATQVLTIGINTVAPTGTVTPNTATINCSSSAPVFTATAFTPTTNMQINWYTATTLGLIPSGVNINTISIQALPIGTHVVTFSNTVNGCVLSRTVTVTSNAYFPTFTPISNTNYTVGCAPNNTTTLCFSSPTSTNGSVDFCFYPGPTMTTSVPSGSFSGSPGASCLTTSLTGQWNLVLRDVVSGCQTSLPVFVIANTVQPHVAFTAPTLTLTCNTPSFLAVGSSTTSNTNVVWNYPVPLPNTTSSASITVGANGFGPNTCSNCASAYGIYTVVVTNTVNACRTTQTVGIDQNFLLPRMITNLSSPNFFSCKTLTVGINVSLVYVGTSTANAIVASNTLITAAPESSITGGPGVVSIVSGNPGTHTVITQGFANGCVSTSVITIGSDYTKPVLAPSNNFTLDCAPSLTNNGVPLQVALSNSLSAWSVLFKAYPAGVSFSPLSFITPPVGGTCTPGSLLSPTISVDKPGVYEYFVKNDVTGCTEVGSLSVTPGIMKSDFTASSQFGYAPLTVNFNNLSGSTGTLNPTSNVISVWSFGNGTYSTSPSNSISPSATYVNPGTYTVLLVSSKGECVDSTFKIITVDIPSKLEIPNVFTPNGDNVNDVFFVKASNLTSIEAVIFDRWGTKVYDVVSKTGNIAWDGKNFKGVECAAGTFYYIIKAEGKDGTVYEKKGNVSLYR
jgi:gliding motility-associated-like protein